MNLKSTLTGTYNSVLLNFAISSFFLSNDPLATLKLKFVQPQLLPSSAESTAHKLQGAVLRAK
jgi:hypothetical protein